MRGHETIIQMRKAGRRPGIIFINDFPSSTRWGEWSEYAQVCTAGDSLADIDLRFVIGLKVSITSESQQRAKSIMQIAINCGATDVGACCMGWAEIWNKKEEGNG